MVNSIKVDNNIVINKLSQPRTESLGFKADKENSADDSFAKVKAEKIEDKTLNAKIILSALSAIPQIRRLNSTPDNVKDSNWPKVIGALALVGIYLPEDTRDLIDAWNQITGKTKTNLKHTKDFQQPFSFFKGTLLEPLLNLKGNMGRKISSFLRNYDKPIYESNLGKFLQKTFGVSIEKKIFTGKTYAKNKKLYEYKLNGSWLSKLAGRSMLRITKLGVAAMCLLEIPAMIKSFKKDDDSKAKLFNTGKQFVKSGINVATTISTIGLIGAALAAYGPAGSIIGMGVGAVAAGYTSGFLNKQVDKIMNKISA